MRQCIVIRHIACEGLGPLAPLLAAHGYALVCLEAGYDALDTRAGREADLLIVLGGPISAYDEAEFPFLAEELALLAARTREDRATLGICLGAQLLARALGARVYPAAAREIGYGPVTLSAPGRVSPLRHLAGPVLHWHGDTYDLPPGTDHLASTGACAQQAFARGRTLLGLQFHLEVEARALESWLIAYAAELAGAGISPQALRAAARSAQPALAAQAPAVFGAWLAALAGAP